MKGFDAVFIHACNDDVFFIHHIDLTPNDCTYFLNDCLRALCRYVPADCIAALQKFSRKNENEKAAPTDSCRVLYDCSEDDVQNYSLRLPQSFFDTAKACTDGKSVKSFSPSFLPPALTLPLFYDIISKSVIKIFGWYTVPEVIDNVIQS